MTSSPFLPTPLTCQPTPVLFLSRNNLIEIRLLKLPVTLSPKYMDSFHIISHVCSQQHTHGGECSYFTFLVLCISPQRSLYLFGWFLVSFADSVSFYPDLILYIGVSKPGPLDRVVGCLFILQMNYSSPHIYSFTFCSFHHPWSAMV